ncbi:MAG: hypothetical protein ACTHLH_06775, partial [Solirubrobacterales bacterium]
MRIHSGATSWLLPPLVILLLLVASVPTVAAAQRTIHFDRRSLRVPTSWPVYRLAQHPRMCVRLDRRAVY